MRIHLIGKYYLYFKWNIRKLIQNSIRKKSGSAVDCTTIYPDESLTQLREKNRCTPATKEFEENKVMQNDVENIITNMCILINETIRQSLPEFKS